MKSYYWVECTIVAFNLFSILLLFKNIQQSPNDRIQSNHLLISINSLYVLLSFVKWRFEGWRMISLVSFLSQTFVNIFIVCECYFSSAIALIFFLIHFYSIFFFKIRPLHNPRGKHHVGFTTFTLNETTTCSIFYPCIERKKKVKAKWLPFEEYWQRMHDTHKKDVSKPGKAPPFFFKFFMDFMKKIQMPFIDHDAPLIDSSDLESDHQGTFPVLLFSHGLAAHANCYISILSELASNGEKSLIYKTSIPSFVIISGA
jgi:hypothetical protein